MNPYMNPYFNPFGMPQQPAPAAPAMQVTKVNGENGARSYSMGPNSSALLLDESGLMVWLCTTDGAGYKTVSPYDIAPHHTAPAPDYGSLEGRIKRLEEIVNGNAKRTATTGKCKSDDGAD